MEFVQFHPTGMVWPPSVKGILVTEGVRGEGGVLRNKEGKRFMFDDIPENYRSQTADNPEEGWRYTQGDKTARRPPELLTRDHVARCINREVKAGRGSPHGGVFLDIAWIKEKLPNSVEHIKKKLPSMYHQFKQLADLDITKEPMEIGPTTHYMMGGIQVDGDTQMSAVPGLFAAGECASGLHGANRLGGNSLSDLLVFGKRAGEYAAKFAKENGAGKINQAEVEAAAKARCRAVRARRRGRESVRGPARIAGHDAEAGRHRARGEAKCSRRWRRSRSCRRARPSAGISGQSRIQHRLAHGARSRQHADYFRDRSRLRASSARKAAAAHFRDDYPEKSAEWGKYNLRITKGPDGKPKIERMPVCR